MRLLVLLNQAAGTLANSATGNEPERIRAGFAAGAVAGAIRSGYDAVVGGGGDGTLNTIAAGLAGSETAFGVLPLGTHNHFAKDLGVPLDLDAAVAALARGTTKAIDVGEVNGRL